MKNLPVVFVGLFIGSDVDGRLHALEALRKLFVFVHDLHLPPQLAQVSAAHSCGRRMVFFRHGWLAGSSRRVQFLASGLRRRTGTTLRQKFASHVLVLSLI